jgi:hypothetical protein
VHQPESRGIDAERGPEGKGAAQALAPGVERRGFRLAAEHPQRDLGTIAEERVTRPVSAGIEDLDHVAGFGLDPRDVGLVDPGVSVAQPLFAALGDGDGGHTL